MHYHLRGKVYPAPRYWERLYPDAEEEAERRDRTPPPRHSGTGWTTTRPTRTARCACASSLPWADRNTLLIACRCLPSNRCRRRAGERSPADPVRIAKPILLTTTPIGVLFGLREAYRLAGRGWRC